MPADKPARMITKLTQTLREKDAAIARLEKLVQDADVLVTAARQAHDGATEHALDLRRRLDAAEGRVTELDYLNTRAADALEAMETRCQAAETALRSSERMRIDVVAERGRLASAAAEVSVAQELIGEQRAELTKLVDAVRDRMRRRELEEASAIMNRRALSACAPERNRR